MDNIESRSLNIIWNITKKCPYNCKICATDDINRKELTDNEKDQAFNSILSFKKYIHSIDFSGGDPLYSEDSKKIIFKAFKALGRDHVFITTTGKGISNLLSSELSLLNNCEVTIETGNVEQYIDNRNGSEYNYDNYEMVMKYAKHINRLTVNVPVFNADISSKDLKNLISVINDIPISTKKVAILRMMPVGKADISLYPHNYEISHIIKCFRDNLNSNIELHLHCALRGKYETTKNNYCNMLESKIGIDCAGNVYACPWGSYLKVGITDNPFYIGNIIMDTLEEIMSSAKFLELNSKLNHNPHCRVFSYILSEGDIFSKADPLYN